MTLRRETTNGSEERFAFFYDSGCSVILLHLSEDVLHALSGLTGIRAPTAADVEVVKTAASVHRITEDNLLPMQPGAQNDMLRASVLMEHPLLVGPRSKAAWGEPAQASLRVEQSPAGFRWRYAGKDGVDRSAGEVDAADVCWAAMALSPRDETPARFRELGAVAPDLAFDSLRSSVFTPSHLMDGVHRHALIRDIHIRDLEPMLTASKAGVVRPKQHVRATPGWSVWHGDEREGIPCAACARGTVIRRYTRRGKPFVGCTEYPTCEFTDWIAPQPLTAFDCDRSDSRNAP